MTIRTTDGDQDAALLTAIGSVTRNSANLAHMFQQVAATVTGSQLVVFAFDDKTLMPQRDLLENLVFATNWNPYAPHPDVQADHRLMILDILTECKQLIVFRNRIAHDVWEVLPSDEIPDRLEARKPVRWSSAMVETSIGSINILARHINLAAGALASVERRIQRSRNGVHDITDRHPENFLQTCQQRRHGIDGFVWRSSKWDGRPQRENRSPYEDDSEAE